MTIDALEKKYGSKYSLEDLRKDPTNRTINWYEISKEDLSTDFIREFKYNLIWPVLCRYQKFTPDLIREFKQHLCWAVASEYQVLPEDLMREFQKKLYWDCVSTSQKMSEEFMIEFMDKIYWKWVPEIPESIKAKLPHEVLETLKLPRFLR